MMTITSATATVIIHINCELALMNREYTKVNVKDSYVIRKVPGFLAIALEG